MAKHTHIFAFDAVNGRYVCACGDSVDDEDLRPGSYVRLVAPADGEGWPTADELID